MGGKERGLGGRGEGEGERYSETDGRVLNEEWYEGEKHREREGEGE